MTRRAQGTVSSTACSLLPWSLAWVWWCQTATTVACRYAAAPPCTVIFLPMRLSDPVRTVAVLCVLLVADLLCAGVRVARHDGHATHAASPCGVDGGRVAGGAAQVAACVVGRVSTSAARVAARCRARHHLVGTARAPQAHVHSPRRCFVSCFQQFKPPRVQVRRTLYLVARARVGTVCWTGQPRIPRARVSRRVLPMKM